MPRTGVATPAPARNASATRSQTGTCSNPGPSPARDEAALPGRPRRSEGVGHRRPDQRGLVVLKELAEGVGEPGAVADLDGERPGAGGAQQGLHEVPSLLADKEGWELEEDRAELARV